MFSFLSKIAISTLAFIGGIFGFQNNLPSPSPLILDSVSPSITITASPTPSTVKPVIKSTPKPASTTMPTPMPFPTPSISLAPTSPTPTPQIIYTHPPTPTPIVIYTTLPTPTPQIIYVIPHFIPAPTPTPTPIPTPTPAPPTQAQLTQACRARYDITVNQREMNEILLESSLNSSITSYQQEIVRLANNGAAVSGYMNRARQNLADAQARLASAKTQYEAALVYYWDTLQTCLDSIAQ